MSSVDDLIASFNANHIGQEAIELAALQAQLSQAFFPQSMTSPVAFNTPRGAPVNTPVSRTPSASISLDPAEAAWVRSRGSSKTRCSIDDSPRETDDMDEDERMVEDLLLASPASPSSPSASFSRPPLPSGAMQASSPFRPRRASISLHTIPLDHSHHDLPSPNTSLFANTDPFYLASLQSLHSPCPSTSVFAQAGHPSAHSPFLMHHMQSMYVPFAHSYQSGPADVQSHNMFAATAAFSS